MIGQTISHYRIVDKLGQGGMGIVYRAHDTKLDRPVALKFLAPELTREETARRRFVQEAKAAAGLNHPNIVTIYEIDELDGQTFIAMEYVAGSSLRERIAEGPLPAGEAEAITLQIARGLGRAHEQGIVHRDVKPGNVLLTRDGQVKIADFGLAMLAGQTRLTRTGTTLGTVAYMSPEQARGTDVTHLTDVWALGVIHYEMLTGRLPFRGDNAQAQIFSILNSRPEPISRYAPAVPRVHDQIIERALAKDPRARFQSAPELARSLQRRAVEELPTLAMRGVRHRFADWFPSRRRRIGSVLLLAVVLGLGYLALRSRGAGDFHERDWLLITEFRNLVGEEGLQSALREALVVDMQQSRHVNVLTGRRLSDALARMGRHADEPITAQLGNELALREGIPVVLTGSVSSLAGGILIAAQLVRPATGEALFAKRVQAAETGGLLPALDELSRAIRERLGESLRSIRAHDEPLAAVTTSSLEALRLFSRGNQAFLASDWERARALLGQAVAEDSTFAMAYAKLARIQFYSANTHDALVYSDKAYHWRQRLTARERTYIEAEYHRYRAEYGEAIECLGALLDEYPDDLEARINLATTYMWTLQYRQALQELERLDPGYRDTWSYHHARGNACGGLEDFAAAAASFRRAIVRGPNQPRSRMCLSWSYFCMGDLPAARAQLDTLRSIRENGTLGTDYLLAETLPALGEFAQALDRLAAARNDALARDNPNQAAWTHLYAGFCHERLGDQAAAVQDFQAAVDIWPGDYPLLHLGMALARHSDVRRAEEVRDRLAKLTRDEPTRAHQQFLCKLEGEIAYQRGDLEQAATLLQECLPDYMFNLDVHFTLGRIHLQQGDLDTAREEFAFLVHNRFSTFHEGLGFLGPLAFYNLGLVEEAAGHPDAARPQLERFLQLWAGADPSLAEVKDARRRLEALRQDR